jgi:hypothetical protein
MRALAATQHMKMPIWNFQKHLVKQARLHTRAPAAAEITVAESSAQRFVFSGKFDFLADQAKFPRSHGSRAKRSAGFRNPSPTIGQADQWRLPVAGGQSSWTARCAFWRSEPADWADIRRLPHSRRKRRNVPGAPAPRRTTRPRGPPDYPGAHPQSSTRTHVGAYEIGRSHHR